MLEKFVSGLHNSYLLHEDSPLRRMNPIGKLIVTLAFLMLLVSFSQYDSFRVLLYSLIPFFIIICFRIRMLEIIKKFVLALPFVFFTGLANCFFDRVQISFHVFQSDIFISGGLLSFLTLFFKTFSAIAAVSILVVCTPFHEISRAMYSIGIPCMLVLQMELMLRYLSMVFEEASVMETAWHLRNPNSKSIPVKNWGMLIGHLFLRSLQHSESVSNAMQCRLFHYGMIQKRQSLKKNDLILMLFIILILVTIRIAI